MGGGRSSGGSRELAELIDKFGEWLIPDLKHYYGIDLRDLFSEDRPLSPRWVLIHAKSLPMESAFIAEQRGGQTYRGWDEGRYQMAALITAIKTLTYITILANSDPKKRKAKPPEPYPTPETRDKKVRDSKPGSFAFMAKSLLAKGKKRRKEGG